MKTNSENNLPITFLEKLELAFPEYKKDILHSYSMEKSSATFRVNPLKSNAVEAEETLNKLWVSWEKISYLKNAYSYSWKERLIWDTDLYKKGKIYMQSSSSQIPTLILEPTSWDKVLDMTAAPWGKTSQIAGLMNNWWEIVACEKNLVRYNKMLHNLEKQGVINVKPLKIDSTALSEKFENETFDKILLDAPCSGEGRFDLNNPKTFAHWDETFVKKISKTQKFLLKAAYPLLKKGWTLVYSTCTLSPEENEAMVHMMLSCYKNLILEDITLDIPHSIKGLTKYGETVYRKDLAKTLRVLPAAWNEWFFVAKFKKLED